MLNSFVKLYNFTKQFHKNNDNMDAYDIFKKLTKGLTFKNKVIGVKKIDKNKNTTFSKKDDVTIKKKELSNENDLELDTMSKQSDNDSDVSQLESNGDSASENDSDIKLMEGVKIVEKKKKKKKEKLEDLQKKLELEEQNRFRNEHGIKAVGRHIPAALSDFTDMMIHYNVSQGLVDTVHQCGYTEPTPVQRQAIPCMLEDRQILTCAPTGSGKTAAFLVPILHTLGAPQGGPRALVLCPTRELAHQIYREALRLSASTELRCSVVRNMKESKVKEREATIRKSDIVISTPNRICYLLNRDNVNVSLEKVRWLIIDEADKLFEGSLQEQSDFRQQMEQIMSACGSKQRKVAMFSATHTPAVAKWSRHNLRGLINVTVGQRNAATHLVEQQLLYCGNESGKLIAFRDLVHQGLKPPVLVFVQSKERAKQLFKELIYDGINVDVIHADRTQAQRDNVVRSFRVGRIWVLICTELLGRGIDFRGVNLVVNYDFPPSAIAYIHRVGRAGRAGQKGRAITFFTQDDVSNLRSIASVMKQSGCEVPDYMLRLKQDANRRRKLMKRAPQRDDISTILQRKRKLDSTNEGNEATKATDKEAVSSGKHNKIKKIQKESSENKTNPSKTNKKVDDKNNFKTKNISNKQKNYQNKENKSNFKQKNNYSKKKNFVNKKQKMLNRK